MEKKLPILSSTLANSPSSPGSSRLAKRKETEARFNRLWLANPKQFDAQRSVKEQERINRTLALLRKHVDLIQKKAVDIGSGGGILTWELSKLGAEVDAVDVSSIALKELSRYPNEIITPIQDCAPITKLNDDSYDLVNCTELIGYLPKDEHRLLFSELARLVKAEGKVLFFSSLDIFSSNPLEQILAAAETELQIEDCVLSTISAGFVAKISLLLQQSLSKQQKTQNLKNRPLTNEKEVVSAGLHSIAGLFLLFFGEGSAFLAPLLL